MSSKVAIQLADAQALVPEPSLPLPAPLSVPAEASPFFHQGLVRLHGGDAREALELFSQAVALAPSFAPARLCLGVAHALNFDIYPAIDHLQQAAALAPDSFTAHYVLAQLYFKLRVPQKGYEEARAALACPQTLDDRRMLTQLLREEREREHNGIARPWFHRQFRASRFWVAGSGLAALLLALAARTSEFGRLLHDIAIHVH